MSNINKLGMRLEKKEQQLTKLEEEVRMLHEKIQEEKESFLIRQIRKIELTPEEYRKLGKGIESRDVFKYLEGKETMNTKCEEVKNEG